MSKGREGFGMEAI